MSCVLIADVLDSKKLYKFLFPAIILGLSAGSPGLAGEKNISYCSENNGSWEKVNSIDKGKIFILQWKGLPKKTFKWIASNADRHNITDNDGDTWNYNDHRTGGGMTLTNLENKNTIECRSLYIFQRPPSSATGTIDNDMRYLDFSNARPPKCDLTLDGACFLKTNLKAKIVRPGIIEVPGIDKIYQTTYGCDSSIIPDMKRVKGYEQGYGICTSQGWVPLTMKPGLPCGWYQKNVSKEISCSFEQEDN